MTTIDTRQNQFENDLQLLKNALNHEKFSVDYSAVKLDSDNITTANAIPNELNESEKITVETHWWGVDFVLNEKLTQDIIAGTIASGPLATAIAAALAAAGVVTGGIATALGAGFAAAFALKAAEIKIVDNGKGVHFPVTWLQWAPVIASIPTGPAGIVAAIMVFIHPVRN